MRQNSIGQYTLVREVGRGGMGVVYEAMSELGERVAIKMLLAQYVGDREVRKRFENELPIVQQIQHPSLVQITDSGTTSAGDAYLVMEYVEGLTLGELVKLGPLSAQSALAITAEVAEAMAAAHTQGIIHRDIKPPNIMVTPHQGREQSPMVKLVDWGIAKILTALDATTSVQTATGIRLGTATYMAPELILGGSITAATDVYALGVTLFEILTGRVPYEDALSFQHVAMPPPIGKLRDAGVGERLQQLIVQMMAKKSSERPAMAEVAAAARQIAEELLHPPTRSWRLSRTALAARLRHPSHSLVTALIMCVVVLLAAVGTAFFRRSPGASVRTATSNASGSVVVPLAAPGAPLVTTEPPTREPTPGAENSAAPEVPNRPMTSTPLHRRQRGADRTRGGAPNAQLSSKTDAAPQAKETAKTDDNYPNLLPP